MASVELQGADTALAKLEKLADRKVSLRVTTKAARQAINVWRKAARANAKRLDDPETSSRIYKNIISRKGRSRKKDRVIMRLGVRGGASRNKHSQDISRLSGGDTRHWRHVEFGNAKTQAAPFMRPAMLNNIGKATSTFSERFQTELDKELKKAGK